MIEYARKVGGGFVISTWVRTFLTRLLTAPLVALSLLAGLLLLGRAARDDLRQEERYTAAFADIECAPPPGMEREAFLDEVQFLASQPDRLALLDETLAARLAEAFARHPWVERVDRVEVTARRQVLVRLVYRVPVLAVPSWPREPGDPELTAVDGNGVLLPPLRCGQNLPELRNTVSRPAGPSGMGWGDPVVLAAARTAALLQPHQERLQVQRYEVKDGVVRLECQERGRIVWGSVPGEEAEGEATAEEKVRRILEGRAMAEEEWDLRQLQP
jgi:hypothetical protein